MEDKTNINNLRNFLLGDIRIFLLNKLLILEKEVYNLKWSINYILSLEKLNDNKKSQFYEDCKFIKDNIGEIQDEKNRHNEKNIASQNLLEKIQEIKKQLMNIDKLKKYTLYELIIILDCIHHRINTTLLKKFEYLHKSYENLILSYNPLYIPNPSISKLAKTPNLMLYFNKQLNYVSRITKNLTNSEKEKKIFSTWNFIHIDHVESINDSDEHVPLEFSFWLYEMPIFHCIAFHEIYHKYYFNDKELKINNIDFFSNNIPLRIRNILNIPKSAIYNLYQEILADLHAYIFAEDMYLYTFFLTGFIRNIYKSFYKEFDTNEQIKPEKRCCFNKHENFSIYGFDYSLDKMTFFIRLKILLTFREKLKLHKKNLLQEQNNRNIENSDIGNKNNDREKFDTITEQIIENIKSILSIVFPPDKDKSNLYSFESLLSNVKEYNNYLFFKAVLNLLFEVYDKFLNKKEVYIKLNRRYDFINNNMEEYNLRCTDYKTIFFDYLISVENYKYNKDISKIAKINYKSQGLFRFLNLKDIFQNNEEINTIIKTILEKEEEKTKIYYLTFIKIARNSNEKLKIDALELFKNIENNKYYYAFGPYDFVGLTKKNYSFLNKIEENIQNHNFFIDNHSLILIKEEYKQTESNLNEIFNLIVALDIKNIFNNKDNNEQLLLELLKKNLSKYKKNYKIFMSMGNEHMVLFIENLNEEDLINILDDIHSIKNEKQALLNDISSTILFNKNIFENNIDDNIEIKDIVILLKLMKNDSLNMNYKKLINILKDVKVYPYKKYGVYDAKIFIDTITIKNLKNLIKELSSISMDIQIEKENKMIIE